MLKHIYRKHTADNYIMFDRVAKYELRQTHSLTLQCYLEISLKFISSHMSTDTRGTVLVVFMPMDIFWEIKNWAKTTLVQFTARCY